MPTFNNNQSNYPLGSGGNASRADKKHITGNKGYVPKVNKHSKAWGNK